MFYRLIAGIVILIAAVILRRPAEDLVQVALWSLLIGSILDVIDNRKE